MKRTKLIVSLCTLIFTLACLTFGVYSAINTSFTASGSITFNNYGIDADITIDIYGVENGTEVDSTDENYGTVTGLKKRTVLASTGSSAEARSAYQANVITTTPTLSLGELKFDELNTTVAEKWASKIVLVISFTNYSKFDAQLSITQKSTTITNLTAVYGTKIKATKSTDGTTGVASTSKLMITLSPTDATAVVSGTFNPQITVKPYKLEKGDLITMALDQTSSNKTYRVLKIDENNSDIVEVLAMHDYKPKQYHNSKEDHTTTDANGKTVQQYAGSDLDTYLNTTWYDTLSDTAKEAIVESDIVQYSYVISGSVFNSSTHASIANYSTKSVVYQDDAKNVTTLKRYVYALDIEDVEAYFGGTIGEDSGIAGTFGKSDIWELFWNPQGKSIGWIYPWFRSARADDSKNVYAVYGNSGNVDNIGVDFSGTARPAFKIDLSKIAWTAA